ncbi:DUF4349 domain-containing protein [Thermoactinospora rubra]|uniref:DUF4349 domain-containing protein n=1 Tax=Thermoactinospora rubra TaxID=1088767 RepID=UPI001301C81A|nr:DUF4349 domain-containing protein [Thermoactinospora rubra]
MSRLRYGMAVAGACAALMLSGCAGGGSFTSTSAPEAQSGSYRAEADAGQAQRQKAAGSPRNETVTSGVKVVQEERKIIYESRMTVRAKDVAQAAERAKQIVNAAGGYLAKEDSSTADQSQARAMLEFKVPPERYPGVLDAFGKELGTRLSLNQGTQDVTLQVADVDSRLKSAEEALASLRTLLKEAKTIGQVLQVEREIRNREAELESLQAQQKELARQVSMATVTLELVGPVTTPSPEPEEEPAGFLGGLKEGWAALVTFVKIVLTVLGVLLPWLVVIVPPLLLGVLLVRRGRRRPGRGGPPVPEPLPEDPGGPPAKEKEPVAP